MILPKKSKRARISLVYELAFFHLSAFTSFGLCDFSVCTKNEMRLHAPI